MTELDARAAKRRTERLAWWKARGVEHPDELTEAPVDPVVVALRVAFYDARKRAKRRGLSFSVSWEQIAALYAMQGGRCALTEIPFSLERVGGAARRPFMPSLDRKVCARGYTPRNVRLVCVAANIAMNEWGLDVLRRLAQGLLANRRISSIGP